LQEGLIRECVCPLSWGNQRKNVLALLW
jgi:hypothetical protein